MTHTPGPWKAGKWAGEQWPERRWSVHSETIGGHAVAVCISPRYSDPEDLSDAHLIAAAPEMRDALEEFVALANMLGWDDLIHKWEDGRAVVVREARRVLAKAEGK